MKVVQNGKYLKVLPTSDTEVKELKEHLMGWRQKRGDFWLTVEDNLINRIVLNLEISNIYSEPVVEKYDTRLKDYQREDVGFMCRVDNCLNANPMGLGKTIETIETLKLADAKSVCIVTPKIIRAQWSDQIKTWWGRDSEIYEKQKRLDKGKIYIVNYDKLRNERVLEKFRSFRWDYVVLDEAHKIKNRSSKQAIAVKLIPSSRRLALTGTPILKYVDDLWSILDFLDERYSGKSYWNFTYYFCKVENTPWGNKIVGITDDTYRQSILNKLLGLFMVRHNSIEVAHGKTIEIVKLPMSVAQRNLYRKEKQLLLNELPENCTIANGAVLTIRLRQTTSWPGMFIENESGPKFEWILEMCKNNIEESIVVFTVFEQTATALKVYLEENGVTTVTITGKNRSDTNLYNKELFLKRGSRVLVGTIGAMGQGYDELQKVSHTIVFIDRDWSPELNRQAEDRLHRMGQDNPVQVYYLECRGSFDQYIGRVNLNKYEGIRRALQSDKES